MSENTTIRTSTGLQSMKELPKGKFDLWSYNFEKKKVEIDTAFKTDSGKKKVYRVTTESGKTFEATTDHRFFVENQGKIEEKRVKNLTIGSKIVIV